jgi:hypothetical protein
VYNWRKMGECDMCWNRRTLKYIIIGALYLIITSCSSGGGGSTGTDNGSGGLRTITLKWNAPTLYTDNTPLPLNDIASYTVYYGTATGMYTQIVNNIPNPDSTPVSWTLNLAAGTYYFVVTATDNGGNESAPSSELNKTI